MPHKLIPIWPDAKGSVVNISDPGRFYCPLKDGVYIAKMTLITGIITRKASKYLSVCLSNLVSKNWESNYHPGGIFTLKARKIPATVNTMPLALLHPHGLYSKEVDKRFGDFSSYLLS